MGKPNRASQDKRARERAKKERKVEKAEQRNIRKEARNERASSSEQGIDPDLVGIYPGPQPPQEN